MEAWKNSVIEPDCGKQRRLTSTAKQNISGYFGGRKTLTVEGQLRLLLPLGEGEEDKPSRTQFGQPFSFLHYGVGC